MHLIDVCTDTRDAKIGYVNSTFMNKNRHNIGHGNQYDFHDVKGVILFFLLCAYFTLFLEMGLSPAGRPCGSGFPAQDHQKPPTQKGAVSFQGFRKRIVEWSGLFFF